MTHYQKALKLSEEIAVLMQALSADECLEIMHFHDNKYCKHCGWQHPKERICQCENDE